jgi:hypothetical protein
MILANMIPSRVISEKDQRVVSCSYFGELVGPVCGRSHCVHHPSAYTRLLKLMVSWVKVRVRIDMP